MSKEVVEKKKNVFEDYDLFEEFEIKKHNYTVADDDVLDFTRWQEDYEDEVNEEDFEQILINEKRKINRQ